jgi:nicotinamide-nucleotide amidase
MDLSVAEIIVIGNEILSGKRTDTNSAFLGRAFSRVGITVDRKVTVPDTHEGIRNTVKDALERVSLVVTSGGLGPTIDDITREALAEASGIALHTDEDYLAEVKRKFESRGITFSENNRSVALVPDRGTFFRNPNGSAPGLLFRGDGFVLVALPGPPQELEPIVEESLIPHLRELDPSLQPRIKRVFRLVGLGESNIDLEVREMVKGEDAIEVASMPHLGWVEVTFSLLEPDDDHRKRFDAVCDRFAERFSGEIFGDGDTTLEGRVGELLKGRGETLATAESCTGGLIGGRITAVAGSSDYFLGSIVAYSNDVKINALSVPLDTLEKHGAVSEPVAAAMARGVRDALGTDWGVSVTGVAGPGGGTDQKPVGLVYIGVAGPSVEQVEQHQFIGDRRGVRERSVIASLNLLRKCLCR